MQIQVTEEEFDALCKNWTKETNSVVGPAPKQRDYIQKNSDSISYLMFLQELEKGMDEELRESADVTKKHVPKETPVAAVEKKASSHASELSSEEFKLLINRIKAKVGFSYII
jgi:hypothetical protein